MSCASCWAPEAKRLPACLLGVGGSRWTLGAGSSGQWSKLHKGSAARWNLISGWRTARALSLQRDWRNQDRRPHLPSASLSNLAAAQRCRRL